MDKVLTPLEAAMLGLWLLGYRWVYGTTPFRNVLASKNGSTWDTMDIKGHQMTDMPSHTDIEIKPWLTAHGITPPEVEK